MAGDDQGERTEAPTAKRRKDYRDKGQVAQSKEVISISVLIGALLYFYFASESIYRLAASFMRRNFTMAATMELTPERLVALYEDNAGVLIRLLLPLFVLSLFFTLGTGMVQTRWLFTVKPLMPDADKLNPINRFKEIFLNPKILIDTLLNVLKITVLGGVVAWMIFGWSETLPALVYMTPHQIGAEIMEMIMKIIMVTALLFIFVAIADYLHQWYQLEKKMRMTKQELKDEFKETEGDPYLKGQIRSRMRDISMNKMIETVPEANVIVTNPTHLAVAIAYDAEKDHAPRVVAKGKGFWAERIKAIGRENGVKIMEDKLLARALYKAVKVGSRIPPELYRAVAEILAYVFRLQGEKPVRRRSA